MMFNYKTGKRNKYTNEKLCKIIYMVCVYIYKYFVIYIYIVYVHIIIINRQYITCNNNLEYNNLSG